MHPRTVSDRRQKKRAMAGRIAEAAPLGAVGDAPRLTGASFELTAPAPACCISPVERQPVWGRDVAARFGSRSREQHAHRPGIVLARVRRGHHHGRHRPRHRPRRTAAPAPPARPAPAESRPRQRQPFCAVVALGTARDRPPRSATVHESDPAHTPKCVRLRVVTSTPLLRTRALPAPREALR